DRLSVGYGLHVGGGSAFPVQLAGQYQGSVTCKRVNEFVLHIGDITADAPGPIAILDDQGVQADFESLVADIAAQVPIYGTGGCGCSEGAGVQGIGCLFDKPVDRTGQSAVEESEVETYVCCSNSFPFQITVTKVNYADL